MEIRQQLYQKQLAASIATFFGYNFIANHPAAGSIDFENHDN